MAAEVKTHYVARLIIERVDKKTHQPGPHATEREITELASIVTRNVVLSSLRAQLSEHLALVEDTE